ncbi:hypothetical protein BC829DRAFT_387906 [Chytridium lagenaria]|nr:hypothetical protein BC829DRAFT_387906 [Chytridium lagenaria]
MSETITSPDASDGCTHCRDPTSPCLLSTVDPSLSPKPRKVRFRERLSIRNITLRPRHPLMLAAAAPPQQRRRTPRWGTFSRDEPSEEPVRLDSPTLMNLVTPVSISSPIQILDPIKIPAEPRASSILDNPRPLPTYEQATNPVCSHCGCRVPSLSDPSPTPTPTSLQNDPPQVDPLPDADEEPPKIKRSEALKTKKNAVSPRRRGRLDQLFDIRISQDITES